MSAEAYDYGYGSQKNYSFDDVNLSIVGHTLNHMGTTDRQRVENPTDGIAHLKSFAEKLPDESVAEFANFIADRMQNKSISPLGFLDNVAASLYDLQRGTDGRYGAETRLDSKLAGVEYSECLRLLLASPALAAEAFGQQFGDVVEFHLVEIGVMPDKDVITTEIDNIDDANDLILLGAQQMVVNQDWEYFGVDPTDVAQLYNAVARITIRNGVIFSPINVFIDEPGKERGLLMEMMDEQKTHMFGDFYLGMTVDVINPEYATFTRDFLYTKCTESVASLNDLDLNAVMLRFTNDLEPSSTLARASSRMVRYMELNPEVYRGIQGEPSEEQ